VSYLLDTVTVVRHFTNVGRIGKTAAQLLTRLDNHFFISVISLMEILSLSEKHRIDINLKDTISRIASSSLYSVVDLISDILQIAEETPFKELHDRLILSTAKWLDVPIILSETEFKKVSGVSVIWN
jgi:PIN domain nuclease of toxin-antitoxin system